MTYSIIFLLTMIIHHTFLITEYYYIVVSPTETSDLERDAITFGYTKLKSRLNHQIKLSQVLYCLLSRRHNIKGMDSILVYLCLQPWAILQYELTLYPRR